MKYININSIGEYPEDFLIAKVDIEKRLIEEGKLEKRMKLDEFILFLNIQETIYMKGQKSIAFRIISGLESDYILYSLLDEDPLLFESFKNKLSSMKYSFDKLKKIEPLDLLQLDLSEEEIFMINFNMYK